MSIRILIADDHEVVRRGLRWLFADSEVEVVGEAANSHQATKMALKLDIDLVLLDVRMPDGDGLRVLSNLQEKKPNLPVLMYSGYKNPNFVARSVALGASGYISKSASRDELLAAIRRVVAGEMLWERDEVRRLSGSLASPRAPVDVEIPLTDRERQVLHLMAEGLTNKEIARNLQISYETVKEHVQHILRKLGVTDRTQAAIWAVRNDVA
jgi:DNA-binding NarL/FixJ family response regulator